jgi:hypothetical protein
MNVWPVSRRSGGFTGMVVVPGSPFTGILQPTLKYKNRRLINEQAKPTADFANRSRTENILEL